MLVSLNQLAGDSDAIPRWRAFEMSHSGIKWEECFLGKRFAQDLVLCILKWLVGIMGSIFVCCLNNVTAVLPFSAASTRVADGCFLPVKMNCGTKTIILVFDGA